LAQSGTTFVLYYIASTRLVKTHTFLKSYAYYNDLWFKQMSI